MTTYEHDALKAQEPFLRELFNLLNNYAPTWYSEDHHDRLANLLDSLGKEPKHAR